MKTKKRTSIVIALLLAFTVTCTSQFGSVTANAKTTTSSPTVEKISKVLDKYFSKKKMELKKGTPEYVEYLQNILLFENNEELKKLPEYEDIKVYAANYIVNFEPIQIDLALNKKSKEKRTIAIPKEMENKTIAELKNDSIIEERQQEAIIANTPNVPLSTRASYSSSQAVSYAKKYATTHNSSYNYFSGANCTNFVSQAVYAGGKGFTIPSDINKRGQAYTTTSYWYNKIFETGAGLAYYKERKYSTAWTTVANFYTYWSNHGASTASYTSKTTLQKNLKLGDIVQLYNGSKWFHSIIITGGSSGSWKYSGNSTDRLNAAVSGLNETKYRVIRVK